MRLDPSRYAGSARRRATRARQAVGYLPFLMSPRPSVAYVGWTGNGNLGDEAMLQAHRRVLAPHPVRQAPNLPGNPALSLLGRRAVSGVCLGGGTLILNGYFRSTLEGLLDAYPAVPRVMLSVGVEHPDYPVGYAGASIADEGPPWVPLLRQFARVNVRGPRSARVLEALGIRCRVVGDPALAVDLPTGVGDPVGDPVEGQPGRHDRRGTVGLNVGLSDDLWGQDEGRLFAEVRSLVHTLLKGGRRVQLVATTEHDESHLRGWAEQLPGVLPPNPADIPSLLRTLSTCDVVIAEKLHALVFAARVGVPGIAMEYRPKCRDFQESVGRGRYCIRTDELTAGLLLQLLEEVDAGLAQQRADLGVEVAALVAEFTEAAEHARTVLKART